jgi:uncharacterized membrane protein YbaN (DUF454 family)
MLRPLLLLTGWLAVALGLLGIVLPLLPTTPFALLAAACLTRSSPRGHRWLLATRLLGPALADWQAGRGVPLRARLVALALLWPWILIAMAATAAPSPLRSLLPAVAIAVSVMVLGLPGARRDRRGHVGRAGPGSDAGPAGAPPAANARPG